MGVGYGGIPLSIEGEAWEGAPYPIFFNFRVYFRYTHNNYVNMET